MWVVIRIGMRMHVDLPKPQIHEASEDACVSACEEVTGNEYVHTHVHVHARAEGRPATSWPIVLPSAVGFDLSYKLQES